MKNASQLTQRNLHTQFCVKMILIAVLKRFRASEILALNECAELKSIYRFECAGFQYIARIKLPLEFLLNNQSSSSSLCSSSLLKVNLMCSEKVFMCLEKRLREVFFNNDKDVICVSKPDV